MTMCFNYKLLWGVLASMLLGITTAFANPANPKPVDVKQSDGTQLTVRLVGDEFYHRTMTIDGYTVMKNSNGDYVYARLVGSKLLPSNVMAHNPQSRSTTELQMLSSLKTGLVDKDAIAQGKQLRGSRDSMLSSQGFDFNNFRGLIVLVNFSDKQFSMPEPNAFYDDMVNTHDYSGFTLNGSFVSCPGSVRDYYYDNSNHIFDPHFDVVGPVNVSYSCTYPQTANFTRIKNIINSALSQVNNSLNFADYDLDNDGDIDMVYFIFAGFGSSFSGNNSNYIWPHTSNLSYYNLYYDGVRFARYACSTEIYGWEASVYGIEGIGTICHEFSHVLGLVDLYDTDYEQSGGWSRHPGDWSVMAGGQGSNYGRNPVGFGLYERYALGFAQPAVIDSYGQYEMQPLDESNTGYRLNTPNADEYFLIENRQAGKWDKNLPGHGMLVFRVDSTNTEVWSPTSNSVNANPEHMYYQLLRAVDNSSNDNQYNPFPGRGNVTALNNLTTPSLLTWDGKENEKGFDDIVESNGIITFTVVNGDGTRPLLYGDVDCDGEVNISDVSELIDLLLSNSADIIERPSADVNGDGFINIADVSDLIDYLLKS